MKTSRTSMWRCFIIMDVSTISPATITIQQDGVYQITFSLYFSVETPDEGPFNPTTYTLGLNVNGFTTPVGAVYAGEQGQFSLNYSGIMALSAGDSVQCDVEASYFTGEPYGNNVTLENGNAYVMQISN